MTKKNEKTRAAESFIQQLFETSHQFRLAADAKLKTSKIDLSAEQVRTLFALRNREGICMGELASLATRDKTTVTRMIDGLERLSLVVRVPSETDRRQMRLYLTTAGKGFVTKVKNMRPNLGSIISEALTPKELESARQALASIAAALKDL